MIPKHYIGEFYAIMSGFLYGFVGYFGIHVLEGGFSISSMQFWRFIIAIVLIGPFAIRELFKYQQSPRELFYTFLGGVGFYGLSSFLYFKASFYLGTGLSMVVFFSFPVFVMFFNIVFYKQKIHPICYIAGLIILIGMMLLIDPSEIKMDILGIVFGVLSSLCFAGFMVTCGKRQLSSNVFTFMVSLGCCVAGLFGCLYQQNFEYPQNIDILIPMFGISLIATLIPIILLQKSMQYISSQKASLLSVLEPVFVVIFGVYLLNEPMNLRHFLGICIILSGAILALFDRSKPSLKS